MPAAHIDHILVGVPDLDATLAGLSTKLGVQPVYGGKHPRGTHNALLSLGAHTYLELIALQPGAKGADFGMADLDGLTAPVPIGWAVSSADAASLRGQLESAGFSLTESTPGSRTTPAGEVLQWHTFDLADDTPGAPFFINWSPGTRHPATTSPSGCTVEAFGITSPSAQKLRALISSLGLTAAASDGAELSFSLRLRCPAGPVEFQTPRHR
jgi:glyoxalase-like protein